MPQSSGSEYSSRRGRGWFYLFLIVAIAAGGWWYSQQEGGEQASQAPAGFGGMRGAFGGPVPVRAAQAEQRQIDHSLRAIGTVTALNTVTVRSRVEGELREIHFTEGDRVEKDALLARIDPRTYEVQLNQALGQLAQTRARLDNARQDLARYQTLHRQQSIARQQLDTQQALVAELQATLEANEAAVENARLQLSFTEITAPVSGRVGLRQTDIGNLVSAGSGDGLVILTQTQPIAIRFSLPQADLPVVVAAQAAAPLKVDVLAADDTTVLAQGELLAIDNQIDTATGTVSLKARTDNADESLFPNQFVNVRLHVDSGDSLAIPVAAVQYGSIGSFVYVIDDEDTVHIQEVVVGQLDGRHVAISAGLSPGDRVVTEGVDRLRDGSEVEVMTDQSDTGSDS
ncbi:MAG TPA: MdtA/MuxA family multidrug efflux RND transporter periplasmic adaptor subunit [Burkholderiaceae bacterium]|nr:MdtA/MuxA family multidrug efflux RND transporter periplasmic adaptor subunit [Burkholderiaceae bacterium]